MRKSLTVLTALLVLVLSPVGKSHAVMPDEILDDPKLEERARKLSANLRCLVCQNQSIDDSDAQLARDLRVLVRERLVAGDTDKDVMDYVVSRYGDFVLLKPRVTAQTMALWASPFVLLAIGGVFAFRTLRRRQVVAGPANLEMTDSDKAVLDALKRD